MMNENRSEIIKQICNNRFGVNGLNWFMNFALAFTVILCVVFMVVINFIQSMYILK